MRLKEMPEAGLVHITKLSLRRGLNRSGQGMGVAWDGIVGDSSRTQKNRNGSQ